jgi:predicted RNA-binding protein with TRAM domain
MDTPAPIEAGKDYDVNIEDIAREGDGIARVEGFVVFVADTKVGDTVKLYVCSIHPQFFCRSSCIQSQNTPVPG